MYGSFEPPPRPRPAAAAGTAATRPLRAAGGFAPGGTAPARSRTCTAAAARRRRQRGHSPREPQARQALPRHRVPALQRQLPPQPAAATRRIPVLVQALNELRILRQICCGLLFQRFHLRFPLHGLLGAVGEGGAFIPEQVDRIRQVEQLALQPHVFLLDLRIHRERRALHADGRREDAHQRVVVLLRDRVELVIVAPRASHGDAQHAARHRVNPLVPVVGQERRR